MALKITILGSGSQDKYSQKLEENVQCALSEMNLEAEVKHVTDEKEIAQYEVTDLPALFINEEFISSDQSLSCEEIKTKIAEIIEK
jgi:transcription initiation factor TFIID subunit TAF12